MTALEADLEDVFTSDIEVDLDAPPPTLEDRTAVDKLMAGVARLEREQAEIRAMFDARRSEIDRKAADLKADLDADEMELLEPLERECRWLLQSVEQWTRAHIPPKARKKTIALTRGRSVSLRGGGGKLHYAVAEPGPHVPDQFVKTERKWQSKTDVKKATERGPEMNADELPDGFVVPEGEVAYKVLLADGTVVPGAVLTEPAEDKFDYKAAV